jgi:hypothetical protein
MEAGVGIDRCVGLPCGGPILRLILRDRPPRLIRGRAFAQRVGRPYSPSCREEVFSENAPVAVNRTDPNEHESVVMRPDLEAKVP